MKKNSFVEGTMIATIAIVIVKIMGMLYVIPFYATVGVMGAALYAYAYNIYAIFLDISAAGIPIAISKVVSEYNALGKMDAKQKTFRIGKKIISFVSIITFIILFLFAREIATLIIGDLEGGNSISSVTAVIRCVSFAVLVIPYLSVSRGFLQGHNIIFPSSISQVIEQVVRIAVILIGSYLALKVFNLSLTTAIGIAVFGAFVGGAVALFYVSNKIFKNKNALSMNEEVKPDGVTNKEISKKIISYAIPFIIINTALSIYNFINMILILRVMNYLGFDAKSVEFITTSITTWGPKINMIIGSLAMGMSVSLIPSIVSAFAINDWGEVNNKFNKAIQIILIISIPLTLIISLLAYPIWTIFYSYNSLGGQILTFSIFIALFQNMYMTVTSTLQSVNKFKAVYLSTILGFLTSAIFSVPLMLLFHKIGIAPFYGAILATCLGYTVSISIALKTLKKEKEIKYRKTILMLFKMLLPIILMVIVIILLKYLIPINVESRLSSILYVGLIGSISALVYLITIFKNGTVYKVFGKDNVSKIIKKLTFGKVNLK